MAEHFVERQDRRIETGHKVHVGRYEKTKWLISFVEMGGEQYTTFENVPDWKREFNTPDEAYAYVEQQIADGKLPESA